MKENQETLTLEFKDKIVKLQWVGLGSEPLDVDEILQIDMNNILMDIITFPVLFNRINNIKADIDFLLRETQLDCTIFEAELYKKHKKALMGNGEKATEGSIDTAVKLDAGYRAKKMQVINVQKQADMIDGLYWSAKSKEKKLDTISAKIKPEEFEGEILKEATNKALIYHGVRILFQKNYFENRR